uniref:Serine/threonine-protein phosphatase 1 regulatory subunit 10 n=1 Tax=Geotrypetes seraphini TaxID=260995 RepID=A0A6P8PD76_GEOSA|nr:serine/threonine-protein phosphatase 1 regulatory subunit 10 [Geotrypetes seraphini]XP_033772808.1 serine/threonine-protein phosphatase 1 regulatory subunit 10 [Geotrypetes seraphini]
MGSGPIDPKELLKGLDCFLGRDGEVKALEGISKIFGLMKESRKMVSRCMYLNILLQTTSQDILTRFIKVGGYKLLNSWLTYCKTTNNMPLLQQILLTLQHLPLTVEHLKQNNTAKLVKQLSKSSEDEELRKLAGILVDDWMAVIRLQSNAQPAEREKKKRREEMKVRSPVHEKAQDVKPEVKMEGNSEENIEKKKEKPKSLRTTAPSHAKFRSTGLEMEAPPPVPAKKNLNTIILSDKYNIKPAPLKRQSTASGPSETPPAEKKYKPLNTTPNTTKEIKVKIIPPQPMESLGFLDALNSAPVPGIKIKKKKKVMSPTSTKSSPFEVKTSTDGGTPKPPSPEPAPSAEPLELDRPSTPVPAIEVAEPMEIASAEPSSALEAKPTESPADASQLTKKGKKKKTVSWPEESKLREYFYFELDETERVNVNKIKDFGEAAKREMMKDRQAFETARRLSHDAMEEKVPWVYPRLIDMTTCLVDSGSSSQEKFTQAEREKGILQELFLSKESVPESPYEPDPETFEPIPPKLIPLDEDSNMDDSCYPEAMDQGPASQSPDLAGGAKLPPVLANLMGSMAAGKGQPGQNPNSAVNMQEILSSIMGGQAGAKPEELMKQADFPDKIKQLLGSLQNQPQGPVPVGHPMQGPGPLPNGFPPAPKNIQHFPPGGPGAPFPGPHGGPGGPGGPVGPRMMGPPPPPPRDGYWEQSNENMRGGPHGGMRGGPFHRGRGGRGGEPYRGRGGRSGGGPHSGGRGGPNNGHDGGHGGHGGMHGGGHGGYGGHGGHGGGHGGHRSGHGGHGGDMSNRPTCRHFMMKGNCRYENNCAFYHPGVNGPPLR